MGRLHTFVVTLRREYRDINWGLRLVGGADLATPLIVTRLDKRGSVPADLGDTDGTHHRPHVKSMGVQNDVRKNTGPLKSRRRYRWTRVNIGSRPRH
ncbi:hypothetical protein RR46_11104 [Papilio xuthus]|uniref:Uncharacterized protein n=1 Tax=Papilio xuthus TaxID=66420 RepID=A0A194PY79_PAPXU|nr:hypothetical protein RR46_11104 [Papilio xuthus]